MVVNIVFKKIIIIMVYRICISWTECGRHTVRRCVAWTMEYLLLEEESGAEHDGVWTPEPTVSWCGTGGYEWWVEFQFHRSMYRMLAYKQGFSPIFP